MTLYGDDCAYQGGLFWVELQVSCGYSTPMVGQPGSCG